MTLRLDVLDAGQGDGLLLTLPDDKFVLVDLGSTKNKGIVRDSIFAYLKDHTPFRNPGQTLEWLILTHGDIDHYNLVREFIETFNVKVVNVIHGGWASEYKGLIDWLETTVGAKIYAPGPTTKPVVLHSASKCELKLLAAGVGDGKSAYDKNTRSAVVSVTYAGRRFLLTGDATVTTEAAIVNAATERGDKPADLLRSDVLKVAHHGSHRTSNAAQWIQIVDPTWAFFCADRSGEVDEETNKRTGHRLPQALTVQLFLQHGKRIRSSAPEVHDYVLSYDVNDYLQYNKAPDIKGDEVPIRVSGPTKAWEMWRNDHGAFTTIETMGLETGDPNDPDYNADIGVQRAVVIKPSGEMELYTTGKLTGA